MTHSFSRSYFTSKFEQEGRADHRYDLFELDHIGALPQLLSNTPGLRGLNVTIPYKQEVIPFLDRLSPTALAVGAVNTIDLRGGVRIGHNTDVDGFRATLMPLIGNGRPRALVLGSGGASRAVIFVLREWGIKFRVVSRSRDTGDLTWDMLDPTLVAVCPLIINTTPLGMFPQLDTMPALPMEAVGSKHILVDLVYNPSQTRFLAEATARGARCVNGLGMLYAQAEAAWRIWNA